MRTVKQEKLELPTGLLKDLQERRASTPHHFTPAVDAMILEARTGNPPIPFKDLPPLAEKHLGLKFTASQLSNRYHRYLSGKRGES